jgi:hypothetical protein
MAISNWTNINNASGILAEANTQTGGYFWVAINFMIFMVIFITLSGTAGWEAAILSGGFIGLLISIFLVYLGLQSVNILGMYVGILVVIIIYIMWSNRYD